MNEPAVMRPRTVQDDYHARMAPILAEEARERQRADRAQVWIDAQMRRWWPLVLPGSLLVAALQYPNLFEPAFTFAMVLFAYALIGVLLLLVLLCLVSYVATRDAGTPWWRGRWRGRS